MSGALEMLISFSNLKKMKFYITKGINEKTSGV